MPIAYHDGAFVEKGDIKVGLTDFGFTRGLTLFELTRVYGGKPFRLDDHLQRFQAGAATLGLKLPLSLPEFQNIVHAICAQNKFPHSAIRFYLTSGENNLSSYGLVQAHGFKPHLIIVEDELRPDHPDAPYGLDFYRRGQTIKIMPPERALPSIKSANYMQAFLASYEAGAEWDDILFTHHKGYVTESTRSNFFCVIDGVLCTPDKDMLLGITRKVILEIARDLKIPTAERTLMPSDIMRSTEAFTTGSIAEMVPIRRINDYVLPTVMQGPIFAPIRQAFSKILKELRPI